MIDNYEFNIIKSLVGYDITENNLRCVDKYISKNMGIFIPSIGFCEYAIKPNHTHPSYSFVILFNNNPQLFEQTICLKENECLLGCLSPNVPHEEKISDTFSRYIAIFINTDFFHKCLYNYGIKELPQLLWNQYAIDSNLITFINKFMNEYEENNLAKNEMLDSLAYIITNEIIRSILNVNKTSIVCENFTINTCCNYMEQHFSEKITVDKLAKLSNMSQSNFNRLFKKTVSVSPIEYLINLRLQKSKKFLREMNNSISDIALKCGFYSLSHFSSCFYKQFNLSPSEYQKIFNNRK